MRALNRSTGAPTRIATRVRVGVAAVATLLAAGALAACSSAQATSGGGSTLTLYSAQHEQTTSAMVAAFTKQTGIKVRVDNDDEDVLTAQIEQEGSKSPADLFYTENSNWLQQLDDKGLLSAVPASTLANVPAADNAPNGDWVGVSARMSVMVYNPSKITPAQLPKSILDMADAQYKGEIELAPSETDFWPLVSSVDRADGDAATKTWLTGLKTNAGGNIVPDNETLVSDVNKGDAAFGVINHYYFYRLQAELGKSAVHAQLAYFAPQDPGYVQDISGAAILKSSKHQAEAQQFLNFLTSAAGQAVLESGESYEYPLKSGVAANPALPPFSTYQPNSFTPADLGTGLNAKTLLQQAGLI